MTLYLNGTTGISGVDGSAGTPAVQGTDTNTGISFPAADTVAVNTGGSERVRCDSSGRVGIGTTSDFSSAKVVVDGGGIGILNKGLLRSSTDGVLQVSADPNNAYGSSAVVFDVDGTERFRCDSSGRLLVGTTSVADSSYKVQIGGHTDETVRTNTLALYGYQTNQASGSIINQIIFGPSANSGAGGAKISQIKGSDNQSDSLAFFTGSTSLSERMRIENNGQLLVGTTSSFALGSSSATGHRFTSAGEAVHYAAGTPCLYVGRQTNDGTIVSINQAGVEEGSISVSGTTVSYNGAHLSRWSQLPSGAERTEILRGSVLSNLDEMCEWGDEDNEQLNRMKVSDVEGDKNVAGVFQGWDDDDNTYTNDFYCAMTGDFIIRIGAGVTVERGDLLMSAGDGTAKPQDDDIIRSKTIAKITSTNVSCTYDDGSYCVPCVLMAC